MKLGITGSRHWKNREQLFAALDEIAKTHDIEEIIHGGAEGADDFADIWAAERGIPVRLFLPDYVRCHAPRLAPLFRNAAIIEECDLVVAFRSPGKSNGTDDCKRRAEKAGKLLAQIEEEVNGHPTS